MMRLCSAVVAVVAVVVAVVVVVVVVVVAVAVSITAVFHEAVGVLYTAAVAAVSVVVHIL